jgi:hypothetical protein
MQKINHPSAIAFALTLSSVTAGCGSVPEHRDTPALSPEIQALIDECRAEQRRQIEAEESPGFSQLQCEYLITNRGIIANSSPNE